MHLSICRLAVAVLGVALTASQSYAGLTWGGSYENTAVGMYLDGESSLYDENRLRLDLDAALGSHVRFSGDIIAKKYFGSTEFAYLALLPSQYGEALTILGDALVTAGLAAPGDMSADDWAYTLSDTFYVDNAAITLQVKRTLVTVGIQQLPTGTGYAWNPTDLWNIKDVLDPGYEKPGHAALRVEQGLGPVTLAAVAGFHRDLGRMPWNASLQTNAGGFDITLIGGSVTRVGYSLLDPSVEYDFQTYAAGLALAGQLWDIGVWFEGAWKRERTDDTYVGQYLLQQTLLASLGVDTSLFASARHQDRDFAQFLLGADYTIGVGNGIYLMAEYLYNGDGRSSDRFYTIEDWERYLSGEALTLGQHTLFGGLSYAVGDLVTASLYAIANLSDRSVALNPRVDVSITDDCTLETYGALPIGGQTDEFGRDQYLGQVRLKVYW